MYEKLTDVSEELFDKVIGVNLKGPFRLAALVGERMVAAGRGSIINVSSTGAVRPTSDIVPYAAAKAGVNAMTVGLAHAFGPNVRVNAIMPGPFLTTISRSWDMDVFDERARTFPLRRAGESSEIVAPRSTSPATPRATRPAPSSRSTAGRSGAWPGRATALRLRAEPAGASHFFLRPVRAQPADVGGTAATPTRSALLIARSAARRTGRSQRARRRARRGFRSGSRCRSRSGA